MKNANLVSLTCCWLALAFTSGCGARESTLPAPPKTVSEYFTIRVGDRAVRMQVAVLPMEMEHGLMGRRDLGPDDGMIFVYPEPQTMSFWMHNTPTPLDIGFFTPAGELEEIYPLLPFDERTVRSHDDHLQFALEMNQNWYREHGLKPGAKLDLTALAAALRARDLDPKKFGLEKN